MKQTVATGVLVPRRYGLGIAEFATPCGPMYGHIGTVPGFYNIAISSPDGVRQVGLMLNLTPVGGRMFPLINATAVQAVREVFAGSPCAAA